MQVCVSINETCIFASWGGNNPLLETRSRQLASANKKMMNTVQIPGTCITDLPFDEDILTHKKHGCPICANWAPIWTGLNFLHFHGVCIIFTVYCTF